MVEDSDEVRACSRRYAYYADWVHGNYLRSKEPLKLGGTQVRMRSGSFGVLADVFRVDS
jgi:hypothetical protein